MGVRVVFGEDAGAIVDGKDEDRLDAEEGQRARHIGGAICLWSMVCFGNGHR